MLGLKWRLPRVDGLKHWFISLFNLCGCWGRDPPWFTIWQTVISRGPWSLSLHQTDKKKYLLPALHRINIRFKWKLEIKKSQRAEFSIGGSGCQGATRNPLLWEYICHFPGSMNVVQPRGAEGTEKQRRRAQTLYMHPCTLVPPIQCYILYPNVNCWYRPDEWSVVTDCRWRWRQPRLTNQDGGSCFVDTKKLKRMNPILHLCQYLTINNSRQYCGGVLCTKGKTLIKTKVRNVGIFAGGEDELRLVMPSGPWKATPIPLHPFGKPAVRVK